VHVSAVQKLVALDFWRGDEESIHTDVRNCSILHSDANLHSDVTNALL